MIGISHGNRLACVFVLALSAAVSGCGPSELLAPPAGWPTDWSGRRLYNTPHALIYASCEADAGEMDRLARAVGAEFRGLTGREPPRGLIIASGPGDGLYVPQAELHYLRSARAGEAISGAKPESNESILENWQRACAGLPEVRLTPEQFVLIQPAAWTADDLVSQMGLPDPNGAGLTYAVGLTTAEVGVRAACNTLEQMVREQDPASAPLVGVVAVVMRPIMAYGVSVAGQTIIFSQMVAAQTDWPADKRRALLDEFKRRKEREMLGILAPP